MAGVEPPGNGPADPAEASYDGQGQRLERGDHQAHPQVQQWVHHECWNSNTTLTETDLLDAIVKVFGATENFDLDAHEVDGQIAPVEFRETDRVFLRGDNRVRLALFAAVDDVQHFLLAEPVMISEALGIDQFAGEFDQALLETFRLGNAAERGDFPALDPFQVVPLAGEYVFKVERVMHALDDARVRVEL